MSTNAVNTLSTILFAGKRTLEFPRLMRDLVEAMVGQCMPLREVSMEGPNRVTYDVGGVRLTAELCEGALTRADYAEYRRPAGPCDPANDEAAVDRLAAHRVRLVLSCGVGDADAGGVDAARETFRAVLARIVAREPTALVLWSHDRILFTADEFARFLAPEEPVVQSAGEEQPAAPRPAAEVTQFPRRPRPVVLRRSAIRPPPLMPANDVPHLPQMQREELDRVRTALYFDGNDAEADASPTLATRLSASAMDMTLLIVALPVGAAVMTHNVLRGRTDIRLSARAMALTGAVMGFIYGAPGQALAALI